MSDNRIDIESSIPQMIHKSCDKPIKTATQAPVPPKKY
jgi:hypothetical protein